MALVEYDGGGGIDQYLAHIDLAAEPASLGGVGYVYEADTIVGPLTGATLVDIAYDYASDLGGLTTLAEFTPITGAALSPGGVIGPNNQWDGGTFDPVGYHMAFDDPDGGMFVALTEDPNPDGYDDAASLVALTAYHPPTGLGTPQEDHISQVGNLPFTVTSAGYGHLFTVWPEAQTEGCAADTYAFTRIQRRDWKFFKWDEWTCTGSSPNLCCADLGPDVTIDAITVPHYIVGP